MGFLGLEFTSFICSAALDFLMEETLNLYGSAPYHTSELRNYHRQGLSFTNLRKNKNKLGLYLGLAAFIVNTILA